MKYIARILISLLIVCFAGPLTVAQNLQNVKDNEHPFLESSAITSEGLSDLYEQSNDFDQHLSLLVNNTPEVTRTLPCIPECSVEDLKNTSTGELLKIMYAGEQNSGWLTENKLIHFEPGIRLNS